MTGYPTALSTLTSRLDSALAVVSSLVGKSRCAGDVVGSSLFNVPGSAFSLIDPTLSRVITTEDPATRNALLNQLAGYTREATLLPTGEREGRVLLWERGEDSWGADATLDLITEPQRIARSVGAVCNKLVTVNWTVPFIVVDQFTGEVRLLEFNDAAAVSAALSGVTPQNNTFAVGLRPRERRNF